MAGCGAEPHLPLDRQALIIDSWIEFKRSAIDLNNWVDPLLVVFAEQPIAAHEEALDEAIALHGELHVAGTCGAKRAAGAVYRGDDLLMEADDGICDPSCEGFLGSGSGFFGHFEIAVLAPRLLKKRAG